jgi:WD40 repeat protein
MGTGYRTSCWLLLIGFLGVTSAAPARLRADEADLGKYGRLLVTRNGPTCGLAFSPDGSCLVSAEESGTITMWDVATD